MPTLKEAAAEFLATDYGRAHGIGVIDGGCPLMFDPAADPAHKVMRVLFTMTGRVPRQVC